MKQDEISSTERLLDIIRNDRNDSRQSPPPVLDPPTSVKPRIRERLTLKKKITVGVEIGYNDLKLVKISPSSDKAQELLGYLQVPFEPDIPQDSPQFSLFLRSALTNFCGPMEKPEIWSAISSARVETRHLRIPKIPKAQIANAVYWTYKKNVPFNEEKEIFDFEILGDIVENKKTYTEVFGYSAPKQEINSLKRLFYQIGFPLAGISIVPFALQNLLRSGMVQAADNVCSLFVGRDWSRITIYRQGNLVLSRGIKAGLKSMTEAIREELAEEHPERSRAPMVDPSLMEHVGAPEKSLPELDPARRALSDYLHGGPQHTDGDRFDRDKIFSMILPALDRLIRQVERTFSHYGLNFQNQTVHQIFISGQIISSPEIVNYIGEQLELPISVMDPFASDSIHLGDIRPPESPMGKEAFVPAIGLALSNSAPTPNFIFTHKEKEKVSRIYRINHVVFAVFILFIVLCVGVYFWKDHRMRQKKQQVAVLQKQLDTFMPQVSRDLVKELVDQAKTKQKTVLTLSKRYLGLAVISEISNMTPSDIRLFSITAELGKPAKNREVQPRKTLLLNGVALGDQITSEATLAQYLTNLKRSPIFSRPVLKKKSIEPFGRKMGLSFAVQLDLV